MKPRLLDLFCGAGGCSMGYHLAGFEVVGVDIEPQPHYPYTFVQSDALTFDLDGFDCYHASPVCKAYTYCNLSPKERYPKLIADVRARLKATGKPYIIENVIGAKRDLRANLLLCASMFGLPMQRHRLFEVGNTDMFLVPPGPCRHENATISVVGHSVWDSSQTGTPRKDGRKRPDSVPVEVGRRAMGIDWMNKEEMAQAIPPAYTEWIGRQLMGVVVNWNDDDFLPHVEDDLRTGAFKISLPKCGDTVIHPVYGESRVCLVDTVYAKGRGWICCNFGNSGQFCCYPDEVERNI